jgi:glutamate-1-semialdehyde 2,1-aminomutase
VSDWRVPGFTSTGSKRPDALFGPDGDAALVPDRLVRAAGCRAWDASGREYIDYVMALGAVALGYGHPAVNRAACDAVENGVVGPLAPLVEEELAAALCAAIPWVEGVRFLKSGAEAVAAAVRLGRVATGRDRVLGCGYHGWLDWCQRGIGIPAAIRGLYAELPFNDVDGTRAAIRGVGDQLAVVAVEPLVVAEPTREWLETLRAETTRVGAVLVFDEIKTAFRLAVGGAAQRYGVHPDLVVLGKAMANGFPLAAVGGRADVMNGVTRTWISSTLATESVALAAARAALTVFTAEDVCGHLHRVGTRLLHGLHKLQHRHPQVVASVGGVAEMCFFHYADDTVSRAVARACAARGMFFKRTAYNFVSLAHDEATVDHSLGVLEEVLHEVGR